jgi:predicted transcriptional regulator
VPRDPTQPPERPDLYVVARFLDKLTKPGATYTRSRLQAAVRLNYDLFRGYLALLEQKGWVRVVGEGSRQECRITPEGLAAYHHLVDWIRDVFGEILR